MADKFDGIFTPIHSIMAGNRAAQLQHINNLNNLSPERDTPVIHKPAASNWKEEAIHEIANDFWKSRQMNSNKSTTSASPRRSVSESPRDGESNQTERPSSIWGGLKNIFLSRLGPFTGNTPTKTDIEIRPPPSKKRKRSSFNQVENDVIGVNAADSTLGAKIIISSDDFFAPAINLLNPKPPKFDPDAYGPFGKIMDGWETRRRRTFGHNWCIIRLAAPTMIKRVEISTRYFTGNYVPRISLEASKGVLPGVLEQWIEDDYPEALIDLNNNTDRTGQGHYVDEGEGFLKIIEDKMSCDDDRGIWFDILPTVPLRPGTPETHLHTFQPIDTQNEPVTYLRLNQFPDGGIARLKVIGEIARSVDPLPPGENFAGILNGALVITYSSAHFSHPNNLLLPYPPENMASGWETARQLGRPGVLKSLPDRNAIDWGHCEREWVVIQLAQRVDIRMITISTEKFIGNPPESFSFEIFDGHRYGMPANCNVKRQKEFFDEMNDDSQWDEVIDGMKLEPDLVQEYDLDQLNVRSKSKPLFATHVRLSMIPDGGIARLGVYGTSSPEVTKNRYAKKIVRSKKE